MNVLLFPTNLPEENDFFKSDITELSRYLNFSADIEGSMVRHTNLKLSDSLYTEVYVGFDTHGYHWSNASVFVVFPLSDADVDPEDDVAKTLASMRFDEEILSIAEDTLDNYMYVHVDDHLYAAFQLKEDVCYRIFGIPSNVTFH